ncbi:MAG TPA: tetratricopeptide repeat protein [Roseiflexaceae bacterium]|nr:tetratricopeptide repeat protein [Roseiflexaceae bacterium]
MTNHDPIQAAETRLAALETSTPADPRALVDTLLDLALALQERRDNQRISALAQRAYDLAADPARPYPTGAQRALLDLGWAAYWQSDYPAALNYALRTDRALLDTDGRYRLLDLQAATFTRLGQYDQALQLLLDDVVPIVQQAPPAGVWRERAANTLNRIGSVYNYLGQHNEAQRFYGEALAIYKEQDQPDQIAMQLNNLADVNLGVPDYEQAIEQAQRGLEQAQRERTRMALLLTLGEAFQGHGQPAEALARLEQALPLAQNARERLHIYRTMGLAYSSLDQAEQARAALEQALEFAQATGSNAELFVGHQALYTFYKQQGDFERALAHCEQFYRCKEQVFNEKADQRLRLLQVMHDTETARRESLLYQEKHAKLEETLRQLEEQQTIIQALSTPLIPLNERAVLIPLIGTIDRQRAQRVLTTLLQGINERRAAIAILDITGVPVVDVQVAQVLIESASASQLLGAQVLITGVRPEVAQTLVSLGAGLDRIITRPTLQDGIAYAVRRTL